MGNSVNHLFEDFIRLIIINMRVSAWFIWYVCNLKMPKILSVYKKNKSLLLNQRFKPSLH